ncbi:MAG: hypothetical protein ACREGB_00155 [Candidatus Saccharimonadales bacterium]
MKMNLAFVVAAVFVILALAQIRNELSHIARSIDGAAETLREVAPKQQYKQQHLACQLPPTPVQPLPPETREQRHERWRRNRR